MGTRVPVWSLHGHSCARAAFTPWSARADTQVILTLFHQSLHANSDTQSKSEQRRAPLLVLLFILSAVNKNMEVYYYIIWWELG